MPKRLTSGGTGKPNAPFFPGGDEECEDEEVRLFMQLAGWNVESPESQARHAKTWLYLNSLVDKAERRRTQRGTLVIGLLSALGSVTLATVIPAFLKWLSVHGGP